MNVSPYNRTAYEYKSNWTLGQSKPNSNPIKPNFKKAKMNVNLYVIEDYENETYLQSKKQTQFKPCPERSRMGQFPKGQNELKIACQKIWPHPKFSFIKAAIDFSVIKAIICGS